MRPRRHARERHLVTLEHAHELAQLAAEGVPVGCGALGEGVEVGIRQEMHALDGMVVGEAGGDALAAGGQRHAHFVLRPGQRLHAPFLAQGAVVVERGVVALDHHHAAERKAQRSREPRVHRRQQAARHVALRNLKLPGDDVRAQHGVHHHVAALVLRNLGQVPELSAYERQGRDGMVAGGDGHHVAVRPAPQVGLVRHQHGRMLVHALPRALLEHKGVRAEIVGAEAALAPHRARLHDCGPPRARVPKAHQKVFEGILHASSSSSS